MFEMLLASNRAAANVLESDRKAAEGREFYDDGYFEAFASGHAAVARTAAERFDRRGRVGHHRRLGASRAARRFPPKRRELRAGFAVQTRSELQPSSRPAMDVYLVPVGRDRYECYYEAAEQEETDEPGEVRAFSRGCARSSTNS